jgi:hypothetical protein
VRTGGASDLQLDSNSTCTPVVGTVANEFRLRFFNSRKRSQRNDKDHSQGALEKSRNALSYHATSGPVALAARRDCPTDIESDVARSRIEFGFEVSPRGRIQVLKMIQ